MRYVKQLDSLRAIAVLLVVITHWFPENNKLTIYTSIFNGVDIFFVLSGFLITRILLQNRIESETSSISKSRVVKSFFVRRVLRIFPIYYLLIFLLLSFASTTGTDIKSSFIYYFTYTSNIYFYNRQAWDGMLSHLWSLSAEEQFYIFWPWLMLFPKKSWLLPIIILSISIGVFSQLLLPGVDILTFACLDGFGMGAFLAWVIAFHPKFLERSKYIWIILAFAGLGLQFVRVFSDSSSLLPSRTLTSLFTIWIIIEIIKPKNKSSFLFNVILNNPMLIFIGKISYGVYLYHMFIPHYTYQFLYSFNTLTLSVSAMANFYLIRVENFLLLLIISYLSWIIIERPILSLKKHFEYRKPVANKTRKAVLEPELASETLIN